MSNSTKFLLISNNVRGQEQLIKSIKCSYLLVEDNIDIDNFFINNNLENITQFGFLYDNDNLFIPFFPTDNQYFGDLFGNFIKKLVEKNSSIIIDIITCNIYRVDQKSRLADLEKLYNIDIRYSLNETGDYQQGGDWLMESDNINIKDDYFNENINDWHFTLFQGFGILFSNDHLRNIFDISNNKVITHHDISGNEINPLYDSSGDLIKYSGNNRAITWGRNFASISAQIQENVTGIYMSNVVVIYKTNGSVIIYDPNNTGTPPNSISSQLQSNVKDVAITTNLGCAALKNDGSVITWGQSWAGGDSTSTSGQLLSGVKKVIANNFFAALKTNGSVVCWPNFIGTEVRPPSQLQSNVVNIYSNNYGFAALRTGGQVITWGHPDFGGNISGPGELVSGSGMINVSGLVQSNVRCIYSNKFTFVAHKFDGSIVTWGSIELGNGWPQRYLLNNTLTNVSGVYFNSEAWAVIRTNGSVVTWGTVDRGGDSSSVSAQLQSGVKAIYSTKIAFAALKIDGSVVTWGANNSGGSMTSPINVSGQLQSDVKAIYSGEIAFAAIKNNNSVVTWGATIYGGNSSSVSSQLQSDITTIYSNGYGFTAKNINNSLISWGVYSISSDISGQVQSDIKTIYTEGLNNFALKGIVTPPFTYPLTYEWQQSDTSNGIFTAISGATISNYVFTQAQVNKFIRVKVYYIDVNSDPGYAFSNVMGPVANVNDPPTGSITISGTAQEGVTLAITNTISDIDGISGPFTFQWQFATTSGGIYNPIGSATLSTYIIQSSNVGNFLRVLVTYTDNFGTLTTVSSNVIGPVLNITNAPTGSAVITGSLTQNSTLSIINTISDINGLSGPFTFQWTQSATSGGTYTNIPGATLSSFVLTQAQVRQFVRVVVSYLDRLGQNYSITSTNNIGPIENVNDLPTGLPVISGTIQRGMTVTATNTISDLDGISGTISYAWWQSDTSGGVATNVASGASLALTSTNANKFLQLRSTYTDNFGVAETVCSIISQVANFYNATFQWQVADTSNGTFSDISGATVSNYVFAQAQVGKFVRVKIYYIDSNSDPGYAFSNVAGPITNVNDPPTGLATISGTAQQGVTLAITNTISDIEGISGPFTFQWQSTTTSGGVYSNIASATSSTYTIVLGDVANYIRVLVIYTDNYGTLTTVSSVAIGPVLNITNAPTGSAVITGSPNQNSILSITNTISDINGISGPFSFQWSQSATSGGTYTNISGATLSSFVLTQAQIGQFIKVVVSYLDGLGQNYSITSTNHIGPITNVNDLPSGSSIINGIIQRGMTVTAANTISDLDGISGTISYAWWQSDTSGGVATNLSVSSSLALTNANSNKFLQLRSTYTDNYGVVETVCSIISQIANFYDATYQWQIADTSNGTFADISGATVSNYIFRPEHVGKFVRVKIYYIDSSSDPGYAFSSVMGPIIAFAPRIYQWKQSDTSTGTFTNITGGTISNYILTQEQVGKYILVNISYVSPSGENISVDSNVVGPVINVQDPTTGTVAITGLPIQNVMLTVSNTINDLDGISGGFTFQWYHGTTSGTINTIISTSSAVTLYQSQVRQYIRVIVSYTDNFGASSTICSNIVGPVANVNDLPTGTVSITGSAYEGQQLSISNTISDIDGISGLLAYQWVIANTNNGPYTNIPGATISTLVLTQSHVGQYIKVIVSYTDNYQTVETISSAFFGPIGNIDNPPTGSLFIYGTPMQSFTLTVSNTIADADGLGLFTYQWLKCTTSGGIWLTLSGTVA